MKARTLGIGFNRKSIQEYPGSVEFPIPKATKKRRHEFSTPDLSDVNEFGILTPPGTSRSRRQFTPRAVIPKFGF